MHPCILYRRFAAALIALCSSPLAALRADDKLFDYREITLDNGLRVVTLEDFSCPIVAVHLWYHVGSKDEDPERNGFAHMFEHMMFRGTDRLGPTDHFEHIRRTGGNCNAYTAFDQTVYVQTLPANQLELALWLEAERMTHLKIDQDSFDTERKVVEEERRLGLNSPYGDVPEKLLPQIFTVHPYRWSPIGNIAHLRAASAQELRDFWTRYYVPNNGTLVIVGAVKHDEAQRLARKYFGWVPRYADPPRVTIKEPLPSELRDIRIKSDNAPAPIVAIAFRTVPQAHPDYVPLQMLGSIFGGGQSSRLYRKLVAEDRSATMAFGGAMSMEQDGAFAGAAVLSPFGGETAKAMAAIDAELEKLRSEPVGERELEKARNQMLSGIVTQNLTVVSKASVLGSAAVLEGDAARVNRRLEDVRRVTREELARVAKEYLRPDRAYKITLERNLLGSIGSFLGLKGKSEEDAPITAERETTPPPPGRQGAVRPANFPDKPPVASLLTYDPTPKFESRTLDNGLKVMVVQNTEVPYLTTRLGLLPGAWTEDKPGAASMAMQMLEKGTAKHTEAQLAEELDYYAISLSGSADLDAATVSAGSLREHTDRAVELMAEIVRTPTFPDEEFDKLRDQVRTGLAISTNEPSYIADRELRQRLYGQHPYARTATGELADVDALTVDDCRRWWQTFVRPDMGVLIFAGDITPRQAFELAQAHFGDWKPAGPKPQVELPPAPPSQPTHIYLVDRPGIQCQIRVAQPGITRHDPDYFVSRVLSGYFGGAFNARLNETIRVKKGLTYGASGGFYANRFAGEFSISTFSKVATTADAVRAIFEELARLKQEPPSAKELDDTISYTLGSFAGQRETPQSVAGDLWLIESQNLPADYFQQMLQRIAKTQADDCTKLARERVNPDQMVVVVVGPAAQVQADLEKISPVTVVKPAPLPEATE